MNTADTLAREAMKAQYDTDIAYHIHIIRFDKDQRCDTPEFGRFAALQTVAREARNRWREAMGLERPEIVAHTSESK